MTISTRNVLLSFFLATALIGCGSDGGGDVGTNPGNNPPPGSSVNFDQLAGTWFGTYDDVSGMRSLTVDIANPTQDGATLTINEVGGNPSDLTGTITRESERVFRFDISNGVEGEGQVRNRGALLLDPAAGHLVWLSANGFQFGVLQKGATPPLASDRTQADVNGTWTGASYTTSGITDGSFDPIQGASSGATCSSASEGAPSDCTVTGGSADRTASSVTLADPQGRWRGSFPGQSDGAPNRIMQVYLSQDKTFAGAWACADGGYPGTCEFFTWKK